MKYKDVCTLYKKAAAKKEYVDLGDGYRMQINSDKDRELAERVKEMSRPYGFVGAMVKSAPAALLAAAIGGAGSLALSEGNPAAGALGAVTSGVGTALWNGISNADVRRMSVADALANIE